MNKIYRKIVVYDPIENHISYVHLLTYEQATDKKASNDAFYDAYEHANHQREMIVGVTIAGTMLQLSPASYKTYIQETESTMRFVNKGRFLCALTKYHEDKKMPYSLF